jgi:uncharacterized protein (DUF2384 family)
VKLGSRALKYYPKEQATIMSTAIARKLESIETKGSLKSVDIANLVSSRPETVSRWRQGKAFPQRDAEKRLLELEFIVDQLSDFYDPLEARLWLFSRQRLLGDKSPAELVQEGQTDQIIAVINQLREGVFL